VLSYQHKPGKWCQKVRLACIVFFFSTVGCW
jgi:hypothetical protein